MYELRLAVPESHVQIVCDALEALDALSVSVEDADAHTDAEQALFGEPGMPPPREGWVRSGVSALFSSHALANAASDLLQAQDFFDECALRGVVAVPEQDWVRLTQSQFTPVEITHDFWIVPTWHSPPAAARTVIRLDPGLAFGTGTHPTTRMCLRWIAGAGDRPGEGGATGAASGSGLGVVLDYGCGSGILAIAASLHGAVRVDAVDIDEAAVLATEQNALANDAVVRAGLPELAVGEYDTVLANILATPLKVLAPLLCSHLAPGGSLVLAGILERQHEELTAAYAPHVRLSVTDSEDGWVLMTATAPAEN
jgi:ribosomal protein L11 methyltransferase